jgi:iron complex transport system ATP-binding protein
VNVTAQDLSVTLDKKAVLHDVGLQVRTGELVGLIGPNGSGKSTLLKSIYRVLKPDAGLISLDGDDLYRLSPQQAARRMAVVRQESSMEVDFTVAEIVMMGRFPHKRFWEADTSEDQRICEEALSRVGMQAFAQRSYLSLSGGEKQRVLIARALAQQAKLLVLDEPTNHLDIRCQLHMLDLLKTLRVTVLAALHDLNLAAMYCDRLYVIREGRIVTSGTPEKVFTPELIRDVFGVEADVMIHPRTGKPHIFFMSERTADGRQSGSRLA